MSFSNTNVKTDKPADPQTHKAKEDATLNEKITDLNAFTDSCKFAMMTTRTPATGLLVSRCMAVGAKENGGVDILFFTNTESGKTDDIAGDSSTNVAFLDATGQWASFSGRASVDTDRATIRQHYSKMLKVWLGDLGDGKHDGGPDDPRIAAIRIRAETITYSFFERGAMGRAAEMAKGAVTGNTPSFTTIRELKPAEIEQWRDANK